MQADEVFPLISLHFVYRRKGKRQGVNGVWNKGVSFDGILQQTSTYAIYKWVLSYQPTSKGGIIRASPG